MDARAPTFKSAKLKPLSDEQFQNTVRFECEQAVDWIESNISELRQKSEAYYEGRTTIQAEPGRSKVTVSIVRDAIHSILPSIGRIFTQTDTVAEFSSDDEEDEAICQQETLYVNSVFNKYGGYKALVYATTDALKSRIGVVKVDLARIEVASHQRTQVMADDELSLLDEDIQNGVVQITEASPVPPPPDAMPLGSADPMDAADPMGSADPMDATGAPDPAGLTDPGQPSPGLLPGLGGGPPAPNLLNVVMTRKSFRNKWSLDCVPPETLIVDVNATCVEDARLIGIRQNMAIYDAMEQLGLSYDDLAPMSMDDSSMLQQEQFTRLRYDPNTYNDNWATDPSSKLVLVTEAWIKIDADGDGVTELRHIICGGINYEILVDEPVSFCPLAVFLTDLQPHVFFPISLAEDLIQDQDALTVMTRSILDNVAMVNQPRTVINENMVSWEDAENTEIGAMIRVQAMGQIEELVTPFTAGQTLPVLDYLHQNSEARSGVTKLSQGIDPNALQATSRIAANAAVMGSDARIEMMARNLAETGLKDLFLCILRTAMHHFKGPTSIKTPAGYTTVNPSMWHDQVNVSMNVGLGNGRIDEKQTTLQGIVMAQQEIVKTLGVSNPLCGWENLRNTYKQLLRLSGIRNVGDYFPFVAPEQLKAFDEQQKQQAAQAAQSQQSPAPDLVGAAKVKSESDIQIAQAKIQAQAQADQAKLQTEQSVKLAEMQKEQEKTIAELTQRHNLEMSALQAEMTTKLTIAAWDNDQKRDAANQKYAVDSYKAQMDAQTKAAVAVENATNQVGTGSSADNPADNTGAPA